MREAEDGNDGLFVVFEGIDGAGTTTQAVRYGSFLRGRRRLAHVTREPSGGPMGSLLRLVLTQRVNLPSRHRDSTMALLFAADRLDHIETEVAPHLRDGYVVISDRYELSSIIYQSIGIEDEGARADMIAWIRHCNRHALKPDITVVVDVDPEVAAQRRRARGGASELFEEPELQARLARAYLEADKIIGGDRLVHVDGNGDVDAVTAAIIRALEPYVKEGP
ncbi:dTMP kinase [Polyangium mundeleinium]|uniref:Thymidylate kinase n=1 Tax=Polyangium mundeleinium TaxID=2995306 RepID=A0ABT5EJI2_9BACT|nr:dTMP kinase [Polyangium mundeleinium]MDC0741998.1 dTMP kinase [Polyangium mundeleinium]